MTYKPEVMSGESLDIAAQRRDELKQLFPGVFTETKDADGNVVSSIDFERLKAELGTFSDIYEGRRERYGMEWPGKRDCMKVIQEPSRATLKPCPDESVDWDTTKNLFIEGDNLEVLKLLQKSYYGKVKLIYIDPPYNTGNEFIYPDNYQETLDTYLEYSGMLDDQGKKFTTNTASEGRYHSKWLNMMFPRLYLAKNLLKDDGVIFISIDDNEVENLRRICNEVFGEENFVANIIWQKKFSRSNDAKYFSTMHDHILCYAKSSAVDSPENSWILNLLPRGKEIPTGYSNPDNDSRGVWTSVVLSAKSGTDKLRYEITTPSGRVCSPPDGRYWSVNQHKFEELVNDNRIWFGKDGSGTPRLKTFLSEVQDGLRPNTIWMHSEVGHNQEARQEVKALFDGKAYFDSPKPVRLIEHILTIASKDDDFIALDFFAGSGTTAHAVMNLNAKDSGKRRFIAVQLPEKIDKNSEAGKAGFKTIADICSKRIRLASEKIKEISKSTDTGFKVLKLTTSCFKEWSSNASQSIDQIQGSLELSVNNLVDGKNAEDILFEILLKAGFEPTESVNKLDLCSKSVYSIANGALLVCLEDQLTADLIDEVIALEPMQFICLDKGFQGNDQLKANTAQAFKARSQDSEAEMVFKVV